MPQRYTQRILDHLADRRYIPRTIDELARDLSIPPDQLKAFRAAVELLLEEGQVVLGSARTIVLPPPGRELLGVFRKHDRGFGFVTPDEPRQHGDLFIPPGNALDAMTGDRVRVRVRHEKRRGLAAGKSPYVGQIVEVIQRSNRQHVGTLQKRGSLYVVHVDGRALTEPVVIRDPHAKDARPGDKVAIELTRYPDAPGELAEGVITEVLGDAGEPEVETLAVMRAYGLPDHFPEEVLEQARRITRQFDDQLIPPDREDLTSQLILTIDPPDARDFDDAISITRYDHPQPDGASWELGVHIADVSHFIEPDSPLDREAYQRGNSTYLPRKVVPMLPELLSNGICSLQEGVNRYTKSCFLRYDAQGRVVASRFARSVVRSSKRLTYIEAQALIDDDLRLARKHAKSEPRYPRPLIHALKLMDELARTIRQRRLAEGMIVLGLPEVELIFDDSGRVIDAQPEDTSFTHTIIEMFMVEANEAAARLFDNLGLPMIRRIHPDPDAHDLTDLRMYARVAGYNIPARPSRHQLQALLDAVRGKPAQHAVHLAVLRTLSKAEYAPDLVGHFALASEHYTHFTSPIRRYPDFVVHRGLDAVIEAQDAHGLPTGKRRGRLAKALAGDPRLPDVERLHQIGRHCSNTERNSEDAEHELRTYLVLELLAQHLGEDFEGTVTGVTGAGVFIELDRYLVDGFVRVAELPGDPGERWRLNPNTGSLVAQRSGKAIAIGDRFTVRIAKVDLTRRSMDLVIIEPVTNGGKGKKKKKAAPKHRTQPPGARKAHQKTMRLKQARSQHGRQRSNRRRRRP